MKGSPDSNKKRAKSQRLGTSNTHKGDRLSASAGKKRTPGPASDGKSSMIEKEQMALEKIKRRQQKEIEAMLENERR